ncbi:dihydrodipicolinate reductase C-terminal domain-containing protein [Patescibacteria group bacterium]
MELGVPGEHLKGHGWHDYIFLSEDGTVRFRLTHNVNGRDVYALGALDAIRFLATHLKPGTVFSMNEVLRGLQQ